MAFFYFKEISPLSAEEGVLKNSLSYQNFLQIAFWFLILGNVTKFERKSKSK